MTFYQLFLVKVLELRIKVIPLHPLSRSNPISQMNRTKLASVMPWRGLVLKQRNLKQNEIEKYRGSEKERVL